ncbi:hypothetical protein FGO68_gene17678 [Halteria grandinella]|uniref:Fumarate reductase/succinate dehydrogenase flavoprotein-like C-terminal domain-containing protein n=1 Tax=Halteria grandinella TaxID=5974 RepID=A0A8J8P6E4_HALGN|nr:hypothetical protein FGO68_gene17678 [Halteria grandinella]
MYDNIITTLNDNHTASNDMIGIDRVQEYLDLIYKASMLTRGATLQPPASLNNSVNRSRLGSRRPSGEASQSVPHLQHTMMLSEKNQEIEKLQECLRKLQEDNSHLSNLVRQKDIQLEQQQELEIKVKELMVEVENLHHQSVRSSANTMNLRSSQKEIVVEEDGSPSNGEELNDERKMYQDSIIAANYNYQIEQLQLKHAKEIEESQYLIQALQEDRQAQEQRLSQNEQALANLQATSETLKAQLKNALEREHQNELEVNRLKKKLSQYIAQSNESVKNYKDQLNDKEKDLNSKSEQIARLKAKLQMLKSIQTQQHARNESTGATTQPTQERRNSGVNQSAVTTKGIGSATTITQINLGTKEQQVIVDIQTNKRLAKDGSQTGIKPHHTRANKLSNGSINSRMFLNQTSEKLSSTATGQSRNMGGNQQQSMPVGNNYLKKGGAQLHYQTAHNVVNLGSSRSHTPNSRNGLTKRDETSNHRLQKYINTAANTAGLLKKDQHQTESNISYNNTLTTSKRKKNAGKRQSSVEDCSSYLNQDFNQTGFYSTAAQGIAPGQTAQLFTTQSELEAIVKNLIGQFASGSNTTRGDQHHLQSNISFSKRKSGQQDSGELGSEGLSSRLTTQRDPAHPLLMTLDKDFLVQLEKSLKKLAKSNEKVKQITREKEQFERQYLKLKDKITIFKEERAEFALEREQLQQQVHKLELRLKQAQVILNLGEVENNRSKSRATLIEENEIRSVQKTALKNYKKAQQEISPKKLTTPGNYHLGSGCSGINGDNLNLGTNDSIQQQQQNTRYSHMGGNTTGHKNYQNNYVVQAPLTCRVSDSYDISLRINSGLNSSHKKTVMFGVQNRHYQQQPSVSNPLDQSSATVKQLNKNSMIQHSTSKREIQLNQTPVQTHQQSVSTSKFLAESSSPNKQTVPHHQKSNTKDSLGSTLPLSLIHQQNARLGKTPTLKINLASRQDEETKKSLNYEEANLPDDPVIISRFSHLPLRNHEGNNNSMISSRNISRASASNLISKKSFQASSINQLMQEQRHIQQQNQALIFGYQTGSYRESNVQYRSPPRIEAQATEPPSYEKSIQKVQSIPTHQPSSPKLIYSREPLNQAPLTYQQITESSSSINILKKIGTESSLGTKAKDRYLTNNIVFAPGITHYDEEYEEGLQTVQRHGEDDEEYEEYEEQDEGEESDERLMMEDIDENNTINTYIMPHGGALQTAGANNGDPRDFSSAVFRMGQAPNSSLGATQSSTEGVINLGPNLNMQVNAIGHMVRRKKQHQMFGVANTQHHKQQKQQQSQYLDEEMPVQFKMLNNSSTAMPMKHSRYTNDTD